MAGEEGVRSKWLKALDLSERGLLPEAIYLFETLHLELKAQLASTKQLKGASRMRELLGELTEKLEREISSHLGFLEANFYCALELDESITNTEATIRKNYRRLVLRYHPDKRPGQSTALFTVIQTAYEALTSREYRPSKSVEQWCAFRRRERVKLREPVGPSAKLREPVKKQATMAPLAQKQAAMAPLAQKQAATAQPLPRQEAGDRGTSLPVSSARRRPASDDRERRRDADPMAAACERLPTPQLRELLTKELRRPPPAFWTRDELIAALVEAASPKEEAALPRLRRESSTSTAEIGDDDDDDDESVSAARYFRRASNSQIRSKDHLSEPQHVARPQTPRDAAALQKEVEFWHHAGGTHDDDDEEEQEEEEEEEEEENHHAAPAPEGGWFWGGANEQGS